MVAFVFKIRVIVGWPMSNSLAIVLRVDFCNNIIRWLFLLKRQLNWSWLTFSSSCLIISNLWPIVSRWWGLLGGMITISMRDARKRRQNWTRKVKKKSSKKASSVQRLVKRMKWRRKVGHRPAAASCAQTDLVWPTHCSPTSTPRIPPLGFIMVRLLVRTISLWVILACLCFSTFRDFFNLSVIWSNAVCAFQLIERSTNRGFTVHWLIWKVLKAKYGDNVDAVSN